MYKDFTEMPVWQRAMDIAIECYFLSERLPRKEDYGLTSQLRRSAESISANIAEAFGRRTNKDKSRVYDISRSEAFETKNHLLYGSRVNYFTDEEVNNILQEIDIIIYELNKIINYLNRVSTQPQPQPQP